MNFEQAYIKSENIEKVISIVERRLNGDLREMKAPIPADIPDSFEAFLASNLKRKIAVSEPSNGWITVVESKEVNDYSMLLAISMELNAKILSFAHYDSVGAWGFVEMVSGNISQNYFSEEDDDIEGCIERIKNENGIKNCVSFFREAVQSKDNTWRIVQVRQ